MAKSKKRTYTCAYCKKEFKAGSWRKYCCAMCRIAAERERERDPEALVRKRQREEERKERKLPIPFNSSSIGLWKHEGGYYTSNSVNLEKLKEKEGCIRFYLSKNKYKQKDGPQPDMIMFINDASLDHAKLVEGKAIIDKDELRRELWDIKGSIDYGESPDDIDAHIGRLLQRWCQ